MDELSLRPIKRISATQAVAEQIVSLIKEGVLKPGQKLPPERDLVALLRAGRTSVREALQGLASLNIVETRHGKGTFVAEIESRSVLDPDMLARLLSREAALAVAQARYLIEPEVTACVARNATDEDRRRIREAFQQMELDQANRRRDPKHHLAFHRAVAEATHNPVVINIEHYLIGLVGDTQEKWRADWTEEEAFAFWGRTLEEHRALVECIEKGDEAGARQRSADHLVGGLRMAERGEIEGHPVEML